MLGTAGVMVGQVGREGGREVGREGGRGGRGGWCGQPVGLAGSMLLGTAGVMVGQVRKNDTAAAATAAVHSPSFPPSLPSAGVS